MIFVTVGTQNFPFVRLFNEIEKLIEKKIIKEEVIMQVGKSNFESKYLETYDFIENEKVNKLIEKSSFVITHAGTGSIISILKKNRKAIVVPRMAKYAEHVDDHQLEITRVFAEKKYIEPVYDINKLQEAIYNVKKFNYMKYTDNENNLLAKSILEYIESLD
ncbi:PssE/Cps14G family polysaccharide biosynthesis glycosyltransferase [Neobacillus niacini]|uniref:PssE/Cps14G family polysaccharide biosynthesis glycosyltransferase n=1 Tax=Neobacillus niacini TaxID=86668 RepID=UPI0007AB7A1D|nr:PssE/Cps14G family polysaccharide biosynthesis glycosyltransferase [Neobacillus niacini]